MITFNGISVLNFKFRGEDILVMVDGRTMMESDDKSSHDPLGHVSEKWGAYYFRYFRNQPIRNKNCLWRPCLLTDRENISQT
jgi:hypothetical protein